MAVMWTKEKFDQISDLYNAGKSKKEICEIMGLGEGQARSAMYRAGLNSRTPYWSDDEVSFLVSCYSGIGFSEELGLDRIAGILGRCKSNVCRKARALGLTNQNRKGKRVCRVRVPMYKDEKSLLEARSEGMKEWHKNNQHPRGMLGKKHTVETKEFLSKKSAENYERMTQDQRAEINMKSAKTRERNGTLYKNKPHGSWASAWREIGGKRKYFRSRWEANYARYLQWLKDRGQIREWEHESKTFWFEGVKRGCVSYLPDFLVVENNGDESYHEVKGWMDDKSKTKIRRMKKYHPAVKLIVITAKEYNAIKKAVMPMIKDWETDNRNR